ncbi:MAG: SusC/RagA family TonB-linked outer membrane protein [Paludibacter sp.]|jgi:TonB-linked SusC/RagA family outer membrane protein|nr:SusC/RagA family TonB-linked outer membrane protein [Paludibacter sp.]
METKFSTNRITLKAFRYSHLFRPCKIVSFLIAVILYSTQVYSNSTTVKGVIVDAYEMPIIGANIVIKNTTTGTVTDTSGEFKLATTTPLPLTLSVRLIGYKTQEVIVDNAHVPVKVILNEEHTILDELIVVGYGTQSRREFTGSVSSVSGDNIKGIPVQSFEQALPGKAAGVSISIPNGQLNSAPVIRIRGINSISLSSYPLVVIDGIPVSTGNISSNRSSNNPLGDINPSDIQSIDILKDAASTAIYGSRAAGGVILITTKKGRYGKISTSYDGWLSVSNPVRLPEMLNAEQYTTLKNEAIANATAIDGLKRDPAYFLSYNENGSIVDTNWKSYVYRTALSHNHSVNVSGGNEQVKYYFSINYTDQEGILKGNSFTRKGIRLNIENKVNKWLTIVGGSNYSISDNGSYDSGSLPGASMTTTGAARLALVLPPNVPAYHPDGSYNLNPSSGTLGSGNNKGTIPLYNPAALFDLSRYTSENSHAIANLSATFKPFPQLEFKTQYAIDRINNVNIAYESSLLGSFAYSTGGSVVNISTLMQNESWSNTLIFNEILARKHHISALIGTDLQVKNLSSWGVNATKASDDYFSYYQGGWTNLTASGNNLSERVFLALFSRINYDFKNKYYFTANFRRDGNSALATTRKFGNFGGVSAGWLLSEEAFFAESQLAKSINSFKITASLGRVGNGNLTNDYSSFNLYSAGIYGSEGSWAIAQQGNPDLTWETSDQTSIGVSLNALQNRLNFELAYFNNNVNGLILSVNQSPSKGIPGNVILANVGSMYNRGIELSSSFEVIRRGNWNWNVSLNYTNIRNRVTSLANNNQDIIGSTGSGNTNITRVGESIGSLYGLKTLRVNPENGQRVFLNAAGEEVQFNGLGKWTYLNGSTAKALSGTDFHILGNVMPKWYGGLNSNLSYKEVELNLHFTYAGGNYIMNRTRSTLTDQIFFNNSTEILDRWTKPGQKTNVPRLVNGDRISFGGSTPISEHVEKGDFLRLQNISLGYRLQEKAVSALRLSSIRLYGQVTNAFLLTGYTGIDPELSANGNSNTAPGVEYNTAGPGRTYTLGLSIAF